VGESAVSGSAVGESVVSVPAISESSVNVNSTETVTVKVAHAMLPATFCATTVRMFDPRWRTIPLAVQFVVPIAIPLAPRSLIHITQVTPTSSDAVPPSVRRGLPVL
jgi:hypothetical protein